MTSTECAQYLEQIRRYFNYLFDQYGFQVAHCEDAPGEARHLVVLESEACRIKFIQNRWDIYVEVGTLAAPIGWQDVAPGQGIRYWYDIGSVLDFLERKPLDINELSQDQPVLTVDQQLAELATALQPVCDQLMALFREDTFERWQREYQEFKREREEQFGKQYEEWQQRQRKLRSRDTRTTGGEHTANFVS